MKTNGVLVGIIIFLTLVVGAGGMYIYLDSQKDDADVNNAETMTTPTTFIITSAPQPSLSPTSSVPAGWEKYTNEEHGFSISYPVGYDALTDSNNLYGWPNAVVLLYNGGQSYDIAVEVWNSASAYQTKLASEEYVVHEVDEKFITLRSLTEEPQNAAIIDTFEKLQ